MSSLDIWLLYMFDTHIKRFVNTWNRWLMDKRCASCRSLLWKRAYFMRAHTSVTTMLSAALIRYMNIIYQAACDNGQLRPTCRISVKLITLVAFIRTFEKCLIIVAHYTRIVFNRSWYNVTDFSREGWGRK